MIPQYVGEILRLYQRGFPKKESHLYSQVEEMACALMVCKGSLPKTYGIAFRYLGSRMVIDSLWQNCRKN